jgi:hypothetical protein
MLLVCSAFRLPGVRVGTRSRAEQCLFVCASGVEGDEAFALSTSSPRRRANVEIETAVLRGNEATRKRGSIFIEKQSR